MLRIKLHPLKSKMHPLQTVIAPPTTDFYQNYGSLPQVHRNFDRITVDFFYAQKPLEIRLFGCSGS